MRQGHVDEMLCSTKQRRVNFSSICNQLLHLFLPRHKGITSSDIAKFLCRCLWPANSPVVLFKVSQKDSTFWWTRTELFLRTLSHLVSNKHVPQCFQKCSTNQLKYPYESWNDHNSAHLRYYQFIFFIIHQLHQPWIYNVYTQSSVSSYFSNEN